MDRRVMKMSHRHGQEALWAEHVYRQRSQKVDVFRARSWFILPTDWL